jgi:hypothetical protein
MMTTINETDIDIDRQLVCRYIGYSKDVEPSARIASLLDEYIENARHLIEPSYSYVIKEIREVNDCYSIIEKDICFEGKVVGGLLEKCDNDNMIVESYVLDAIGSSAVESLAEYVQGIVGEIAYHNGLSISRRFSPGYCDWPITEQEKIFSVLDRHSSLVNLSSDHMMSPQKSVSGIIGIGSGENGVAAYNPCKTCEKRNCVGRR